MRRKLWVGIWVAAATAASAQTPRLQFEVASVKPHAAGDMSMSWTINVDSFTFRGGDLESLLQYAYGQEPHEEVTGLPSDLKNKHWDIAAKSDADTVAALKKMTDKERGQAQRSMVRDLLADRFGLQAHVVTKDAPIYELVVAKGGPKLKAADPSLDSAEEGPPRDGEKRNGTVYVMSGHLIGTGVEISALAKMLRFQLEREIVDKTGLKGRYDIDLKWQPDEGGDAKASGEAANLPTLPTALEEQLGLHLAAARGPVEAIVVDKAHMPTEN